MQKASLAEMAAIVDEMAEHERGILAHYLKFMPDAPPDMPRLRRAFVLESCANVLRIMATFEDKSRKFIGGLIAEHSRG